YPKNNMARKFTPLIEEETALLDSAKELTIKYCKISKTFRYNKIWTPFKEELLIKLIKEQLTFAKFSHITEIQVDLSEEPLVQTTAIITTTGTLDGKAYTQEFDYEYKVLYT